MFILSLISSLIIDSRFTWSDPLLKIAFDANQGMMCLHAQVYLLSSIET